MFLRREGARNDSKFATLPMNNVDDDSPWDADPNLSHPRQSEWSKISSEFTNVRHNRSSESTPNSNLIIALNRQVTAKA